MKFIAFCTKGLEKIVEDEIKRKINDVNIISVEEKIVIFETNTRIEKLILLRTVDDLCVFVERIEDISTFELAEKLQEIDLNFHKNNIQEYRVVSETFSITTSIARASIKPKEIIEMLSNRITKKYGWKFTEFDHSNFDIRIFIDRMKCVVGVRIAKDSLQNRPYKIASLPGSLKSTIAAALVMLGCGERKNLKVVDNFCGSGTILCEAIKIGCKIYGGDLNSESVNKTKQNLSYFSKNLDDNIKVLDATKTNWQDNFFDVAISNLPWDKQIEVDSITDLYIGSLKEYKRILKENSPGVFLVSKPELFIKYAKTIFKNYKITSLPINFLGQNPTIVVLKI